MCDSTLHILVAVTVDSKKGKVTVTIKLYQHSNNGKKSMLLCSVDMQGREVALGVLQQTSCLQKRLAVRVAMVSYCVHLNADDPGQPWHQ